MSNVNRVHRQLLRTCAELPIAHRERFILLLLRQARLPGGTACYGPWEEWNSWQRGLVYINLLGISEDLANSWYAWAWALSENGSSCSPLERVFRLIDELIKQIAMEEVNQWLQG